MARFGVVVLCLAVASVAGADEPSRFHIGLDVAWRREQVRFLSAATFVGCDDCAPPPMSGDGLRGSASIGFAGIALEGSLAMPYRGDAPTTWTLGARLDTGYASPVSVAFRLAYLRRWGELSGIGGRLGLALQVRVVRAIVGYAEAGLDVVTAPPDSQAVLSYAAYYAAGLRFVFAP